jgi:hypothetical protein
MLYFIERCAIVHHRAAKDTPQVVYALITQPQFRTYSIPVVEAAVVGLEPDWADEQPSLLHAIFLLSQRLCSIYGVQ